jgi:hypothetical protein
MQACGWIRIKRREKEQCRANARSLEAEINRLQSDYTDLLGLFWRRSREFWAHGESRQCSRA